MPLSRSDTFALPLFTPAEPAAPGGLPIPPLHTRCHPGCSRTCCGLLSVILAVLEELPESFRRSRPVVRSSYSLTSRAFRRSKTSVSPSMILTSFSASCTRRVQRACGCEDSTPRHEEKQASIVFLGGAEVATREVTSSGHGKCAS